jgi:hypothetical protein
MIENIEYQHPLIIGTGGGNDIVSASLVLADLRKKGIKGDIAGICSPATFHNYNGNPENPVNLVSKNTSRYIPSKNRTRLSFIDAELPELLEKEDISCNVYNLSCRFGTSRLIDNLEELIAREKYDGIIAVDVGGDILARGKEDPTILSPLMDFTTLYAVSQLKIPSVLVEFGLQTDGELRPKGCQEILLELQNKKIIQYETKISLQDSAVQKFKSIFEIIKKTRAGHTGVMTLKTLEETEDIHTNYRFTNRVLDKKVIYEFPIVLEAKYFGKAFILDLKKIAEARELAFPYKNALELLIKTKQIVNTKTEMDLLYYQHFDNCIWLGLESPQISGTERQELLNYGLDNLQGHADTALLWKNEKNLRVKKFNREAQNFLITGDDEMKVNRLADYLQELKT